MREIGYSDLTWKKNKLYHGDIYWGEIIKHETLPKMYKIYWAGNGEFSTDFWNRARAQDNFVKMVVFLSNMMAKAASEMSVHALKSEIGTTPAPVLK